MNTVFIPGYPVLRNIAPPNAFPVYKTAFVASEPSVFDGPPYFFVDGKTKKGWSGSPVLFDPGQNMHFGMYNMAAASRFLIAVYSCREEDDKELMKVELGVAWPVRQCLFPILQKQVGEHT
jgi:hypothetical protein